MDKKEKFGFVDLAKKSIAILTSSLTSLLSNHSTALSTESLLNTNQTNLKNYEYFQTKILKAKMVLKINPRNLENGLLKMYVNHGSHGSHRSHSSHSSHSSHASHYSSSTYTPSPPPTYKPNTPPPTYKPSTPPPTYKPSTPPPKESLAFYIFGSRIIKLGLEGTDVEELQNILVKLGYDVPKTGYFETLTDSAVRNFQSINGLKIDGKVGIRTLSVLRRLIK